MPRSIKNKPVADSVFFNSLVPWDYNAVISGLACEVMDLSYLNYETAALEAKLGEKQLAVMKEVIRREFPTDDMMWELHFLVGKSRFTTLLFLFGGVL